MRAGVVRDILRSRQAYLHSELPNYSTMASTGSLIGFKWKRDLSVCEYHLDDRLSSSIKVEYVFVDETVESHGQVFVAVPMKVTLALCRCD